MATDNLSLVLHKIDDMRLEQRPIPKPGKNEVLIKMHSVGICGSDVHYWKEGRINRFIVNEPMVLGHEPSGTIAEVGEGVTDFKKGDRVVIEPGISCLECEFCKKGTYNLCPDVKFCATPPVDGTLCRYYVHHSKFCFKLPDNVSLEEAALIEPLAVAVHACRRSNVSIGKSVLISGSGPIGLMNLLTAKAMGASKVCVVDVVQKRLDFAKTLGADHVVRCTTKDTEAFAQQVIDVMGGPPDITLECSGVEPSIQLGLLATKSGGVMTLIGVGPRNITLPLMEASTREVDIRGIFRYANCHPTALELIASGKVNVKPLITHHFTLEESIKAFEVAQAGEGIKVLINCETKK